MRNAQQLRLEEPERRSLLSPHRAPQRQLHSRGTARGHRRVSAPALGGWEGDAVNGAKLPPGTEAGAPRGVGRGARSGPRPAPARGCAPGRRGPRVPPPTPKVPGSVRRPLAPQGRRITLEQHRQDLHLAFAALTAQSCFSPASQGDEEAARAPLEPVGLCCPRPQAWGPHNCMATRSGQQASCPKTIKATLARLLAARSALPLRARNLTPQPCHPPYPVTCPPTCASHWDAYPWPRALPSGLEAPRGMDAMAST